MCNDGTGGMTMDTQWVDAPTGPGLWWRCVGATAPVLCRVSGDAAGLSVERVDGLEVLYLATPFAGVKWRRKVPAVTDETTRLRALLEQTEMPWRAVDVVDGGTVLGRGTAILRPHSRWLVRRVAEVEMGDGEECDTSHAALIVAAVNALPGLLDSAERAERAERERDSLRAQLDTVAEAYRALLAGQPVPEYTGPVLSERGRAVLDRVWPRRDTAAERERDDVAATLETRTAEHALAVERVRELEAIIAGRTTPPTDAEIEAHAAAGGGWLVKWVVGTTTQRIVGDEFGAVHGVANVQEWRDRCEVSRWVALDVEGRPCAWPAEVSRG